jgi:hypothetical protein
MALSSRTIGAGTGATLLLAASFAGAETTSQPAPQPGQERTETRPQNPDQVNRMVEHCTRMMPNWSQ